MTRGMRHGQRYTITYARWRAMMQRTRLPASSTHHQYYGARGVVVCPRWHAFVNFYADMGECPDASMTLDRIDNALGYQPGNCRWATVQEQNANRSNCIVLQHQGQTHTATEWAMRLGMKPNTLLMRLRLGWSTEKALTTPVKKRGHAVSGDLSKIYRTSTSS